MYFPFRRKHGIVFPRMLVSGPWLTHSPVRLHVVRHEIYLYFLCFLIKAFSPFSGVKPCCWWPCEAYCKASVAEGKCLDKSVSREDSTLCVWRIAGVCLSEWRTCACRNSMRLHGKFVFYLFGGGRLNCKHDGEWRICRCLCDGRLFVQFVQIANVHSATCVSGSHSLGTRLE